MAKKKKQRKKRNITRKLSEIYGFDPMKVDFVDVDLEDDLALFVDPLLLWRSPHPEHHEVHAMVIGFFEEAIGLVKNGRKAQAKKRFIFPEPENLLGVSRKGHKGRGMNAELGGRIFNTIVGNKDVLKHGLVFVNELQLMVEKVGPDMVSDMTVNIAKEFFVEYTQRNCKLHNIPMEQTLTDFYLPDEDRWDQALVDLPIHPDTQNGYLLTPRVIVRRKDLALGYKEAYQSYLRNFFRERVMAELEGLAQKPKVTWKRVKKSYPDTKSIVVDAIKDNPSYRHEIVEGVERNLGKRGLEVSIDRLRDLDVDAKISVGALQEIEKSLQDEILKGEIKAMISRAELQHTAIASSAILLLVDDLNEILKRAGDELVVILGSYNSDQKDPFEEVEKSLEEDYETCIIKDMPDIHHVNPRQKLFTYGALSRFIVVLDFGPSGHLSEIELLKDFTKPVILISKDEKGASYMTSGLEFSHTYYSRFTIDKFGSLEKALSAGVDWANGLVKETARRNKEALPWLTEP